MTRLSDAFDRARANDVQESELLVGRSWNTPDEATQAWDIGEEPPIRREPAPSTRQERTPLATRHERALPLRSTMPPQAGPAAATWSGYHFSNDARDKVVVSDLVELAVRERYNHIAAALHHAQAQKNVRSVMVTSGVPAEGKSLTATNVALSLSHSYERRVLLIDADLRNPAIHEIFQEPNDVGLGDLLKRPDRGHLTLRQVSPTLWIQPAGRPDSDPMSALISEGMKQLLTEAVEQFDWVIIDTPPIVVLPDAGLLAAMVDTALLVIRANRTPYPLVQRAIEAIGPSKVLGVVLNGTENTSLGDPYDSYHSYYARQKNSSPPARAVTYNILRRTLAKDRD
jgi:protein-tyrosine kinase